MIFISFLPQWLYCSLFVGTAIFKYLVLSLSIILTKLLSEMKKMEKPLWGHQSFNCIDERLFQVNFEKQCLQGLQYIILRIKLMLPPLQQNKNDKDIKMHNASKYLIYLFLRNKKMLK